MRFSTLCKVELEEGTGMGVTRDLSTTGFHFTADEPLPIGSMLRCVILMPKKDDKVVRLRCEGQVVRTDKSVDGWDIAINFTSFEW